MFMPSLWNENLLDDFFETPAFRSFGTKQPVRMMNTDVKDKGNAYELSIELPGFKKEDVKAELEKGYLTISAQTNENKDTKDEDGRYIRRERYSGSCSRRFFVGEQVTEEDIKANFTDGILRLDIPKKEAQPEVETKHYIAING